MTSRDWWLVGARLLGVYLVVSGGLYAAGALAAFGVRLPEGSNQLLYVGTPMLQALITAGAGLWLILMAPCEAYRPYLQPAAPRAGRKSAPGPRSRTGDRCNSVFRPHRPVHSHSSADAGQDADSERYSVTLSPTPEENT